MYKLSYKKVILSFIIPIFVEMFQNIMSESAPRTKKEVVRFCITGTIVTAILYGIYYAMLYLDFSVDLSFTTGFIVSFACNFFLTNYYTFKTRVDFENGIRFSLCQAINFLMQYVTLKIFVAIGIPEKVALVPVWAIIFPINFWLMRTVLRSDRFRVHLHKAAKEEHAGTM